MLYRDAADRIGTLAQATALQLLRETRAMNTTAAVRSSALGTRIASVVPLPFSPAVPGITSSAVPYSDHWDWDRRDTATTPPTTTAANAMSTAKSTRPTSAPLRRRTGRGGSGKTTPDGHHNHRRQQGTPARTHRAGRVGDAIPGKPSPVLTTRMRLGQVGRDGVREGGRWGRSRQGY